MQPMKTQTGTTVIPEESEVQDEWITMSSRWNDQRMQPWNVFKTQNFNANWGQGEFTCIHTLADKEGPWWKAEFGGKATVTKVQILNRGDCCGGRLKGTRVFVGDQLCGTIEDAPSGAWISVNCKAQGEFLKV